MAQATVVLSPPWEPQTKFPVLGFGPVTSWLLGAFGKGTSRWVLSLSAYFCPSLTNTLFKAFKRKIMTSLLLALAGSCKAQIKEPQ